MKRYRFSDPASSGAGDACGSRKPRPVMESVEGPWWIVLGFGRWWSCCWLEEAPNRYWSSERRNRTVPSPRPIARWESPAESAMHDTGWGAEPCWILAERKRGGVPLAFEVCSRSHILRMG